jgi:hypothetical protein
MFMAVGGFILVLGLVLIVVGYTNGPLEFTSGAKGYGLNLELFGAVICPTGAAILFYGLAAKQTIEEID